MERKTKLFRKVAVICMMFSVILLWGSCQKNAESQNLAQDSTNLQTSAVAATTAATTATVYTVDLTGLKSDGGYSYKIGYPLSVSGDSNTAETASTLLLYENGVQLKPAHSYHDDIRNLGKGRYSHWGTTLYFSASDNTNPATNGRKYTYTLGTAASAPASTPSTTLPDEVPGLIGYAMYNGTTTGGVGGTSVTVTTLDGLRSAVKGNSPKIVYISGAIKSTGDDLVYVGSNTSIIGKPSASVEGLTLFMETVSNVIIQDLRLKNYVYDAGVQIKYSSHHIWVDHCEFSCDRSQWGYWGKDIAITRESDFVTVSWCKFHDNNLSVLISGGIVGHEADKGKLHITLHHNYWYNISEREPTMNYGSVHMFNNYHLNNDSYSISARAGGTVRTDNEYFSNCHKPITTNLDGDPPGYISGANTNTYVNCLANDITTPTSTWVPEYSYKQYLNSASYVPALVIKYTGPRAIH
ncbi:pectate lyase family protein [Mucilaginibacter sp. SP1R1]|uniref:pectate lyase family protein n=1 Tax=Mucilaginibacter sp. SP1R1 TaxID=2723091 RepID=UPI0016182B33|nr:pectate lyase [Mucilaginibacter sp. SP1R1]MBB6151148.1 pectate lyase [Mucilaginibacter sp. SP1R1]